MILLIFKHIPIYPPREKNVWKASLTISRDVHGIKKPQFYFVLRDDPGLYDLFC
jgi:hypothetical protein